jgi:hypothetical protein
MGRLQLCNLNLKGLPVVLKLEGLPQVVPIDVEAVAVVTAIIIIVVEVEEQLLAVVSVDASYSAAYPASSAHSAKGDAVVMGK